MDQFGPGLAALLGFLEGLTEYLPVSSTGHLILLGHWLGFTGDIAVSVEICIQIGAVLAVVVYERKKIAGLLRQGLLEQREFRQRLMAPQEPGTPHSWQSTLRHSMVQHRNLWFLLGLGAAFIPAAIVGLIAHDWIEAHLFSPKTVAISLIIGGIIILVVETWPKTVKISQLEQVGLPAAIGVGLAQCVALIPGMSRSGSTIVGGLLIGLDRKVATEFSFFLALPTMFAATGYKLLQSFHLFSASDIIALLIGMVVSFLVAWVVIASFLTYVKRHTLKVFGYYRIVLGTIILMIL
ncbi:undecaprenyl-diphosphate phosphatase [Candidatus Nitronereus thalassa]|uniref:Undecaprenyl-diphosphatase n=1 Tax=Candidatus Nitronereus thalassa TaxID=3020898 RepID=A0ABU3KAZ0_9BACT|nr:undecaprenyl-diphosphate phosphatase [Candidatus Nitronereus thalassa]MDT7043517.1 undecaprenyl-diphosphate phosphatase [Candidatus Nitronereus thalassa]